MKWVSKLLESQLFQKWYPPIGALIITIIVVNIFGFCSSFTNFNKLLDGAIMFSSIILGFLGVLLGILFTLRDLKLIKVIFEHTKKKTLLNYFRAALISGISIVVISCFLYIRAEINDFIISGVKLDLVNYITDLWVFLVFYFGLTSQRIVSIMMDIIFKEKKSGVEQPQTKKLSQGEVNKLEENLKQNKENSENH
ncbi:hypothetical protein Halha_2167 [Halobacteroides halobius DSM 5150]|uniref:Uncharacterized protein n=1 Tax=Halobacteroides halobius (strain ATCC 35273 / DSM 5150 / MD-1) TaxID=748449 RepID=L0KBX0_HALHC|nr:hypothetical protein [Halobacteroides halobius]AGB42050.1 hypothetical protein Halha_2167 [Halobacteroides halobius DSM 5150]